MGNTDYRDRLRAWRKNIPDIYNGSFRRTWDKAISKKSMRAAVDAKCQDCICWQNTEIKRCEIITCPLWQYRPQQDRDQTQEKAVRDCMQDITVDPYR